MIYNVKTIKKGDNHPAESHIGDEEMVIVEAESGEWWDAEEFFHVMEIDRFETDGEEWHK
jgi:hypothetical protein